MRQRPWPLSVHRARKPCWARDRGRGEGGICSALEGKCASNKIKSFFFYKAFSGGGWGEAKKVKAWERKRRIRKREILSFSEIGSYIFLEKGIRKMCISVIHSFLSFAYFAKQQAIVTHYPLSKVAYCVEVKYTILVIRITLKGS